MNREEKLIENINKRINDLKIKSGKVVGFGRDYDEDLEEFMNSGHFYLYDVENGQPIVSSEIELVPYNWNDGDSERENLRKANKEADDYTQAFNANDQEARDMLENDLYYLSDWGMTFADSWDSAVEVLGESVSEVALGISKEIGKDGAKDVVVGIDDTGTSNLVDKGVYAKEEIEKKQANNIAEAMKLMAGIVYNEAGEEWKSGTYSELIEKVKFGENISKDLIKKIAGNFAAVYGPAILEVRKQLRSGMITERDFLRTLNREIQLNRIAARTMGMIMCLGTSFIKTCILQLVLLGGTLCLSAQPLSMGVREAVKGKMEDGEVNSKQVVTEIKNALEKQFNLKKLFFGNDNISMLFATNSEDKMIAELEIDGPAVGDMFEIVGENLKDLNFKGVLKGLNPQDKEKYKNEVKGVKCYYGSVPAIGNLMSQEDENGRDQNFVAFFEFSNPIYSEGVSHSGYKGIMNKIIDNVFNKKTNPTTGEEEYILTSFKDVEYKKDVPRLIHSLDSEKKNQIIIHTYKVGEKHVVFFPFEAKRTVRNLAPDSYFGRLKKFGDNYLRKLLKQGIEVGEGWDRVNWDYYLITHISILDKQAAEYNLDLEKNQITYKDILDKKYNQFIYEDNYLKKGLTGNIFSDNEKDFKDNYLILSSKYQDHQFFSSTYNILEGSLEDKKGDKVDLLLKLLNLKEDKDPSDKFEYLAGFGDRKDYGDGNKGIGDILINGHKVGQNLNLKKKLVREEDERVEYEEEIYKDEDKKEVLFTVEYKYYPKSNNLIINYGKGDSLKIENFKNNDYGVFLPKVYNVVHGSFGSNKQGVGDPAFVQETEEIKEYLGKGGEAITLDGQVIGREIEFIGEGGSAQGKEYYLYSDKEFEDIYYLYTLDGNMVLIQYGDYSGNQGEVLYKNSILIEDFKNGDFGLRFEVEYPVLYGRDNVVNVNNYHKEYKFDEGNNCYIYNDSNGEGTIFINGSSSREVDIRNYLRNNKQNEFKDNYRNYYLLKGTTLTIKYGQTLVISDPEGTVQKNKEEGYTIEIKKFRNGDYGINLPIQIGYLSGSGGQSA
jgi:hypothetical protein